MIVSFAFNQHLLNLNLTNQLVKEKAPAAMCRKVAEV